MQATVREEMLHSFGHTARVDYVVELPDGTEIARRWGRWPRRGGGAGRGGEKGAVGEGGGFGLSYPQPNDSGLDG